MIFELIKKEYYKKKKQRKIKKIEKEIPFILRNIATLINAGLSFEKTIEKISYSDYHCSEEFLKTRNEIILGENVPNALQHFSKRNKSKEINKMINLLISTYVNGENINVLKKVADEQSNLIQNKLKEYNEKLTLYSLAIIGVSAVLPAFTQGFLIIGSAFMDLGISEKQAFLIIVLLFPLINVVIFWISVSKKP